MTLDLSNADPQADSALYTTLAPELRLAIYEPVLAAHLSPLEEHQYQYHWFHYRPGYTARKVTDLRLLRVCKRVYQESVGLVFARGSGNDEQAFWWGSHKRRPGSLLVPPEGISKKQLQELRAAIDETTPLQSHRARSFTPAQWQKITTIQIFPQMYTFSPATFASFFDAVPHLRPRVVKVTFRYTDWWWWENDSELSLYIGPTTLKKHQEKVYYFPESVEELVMELETIEANRTDVEREMKMVLGAKDDWKWRRLDDVFLVLDEERTDEEVLKEEESWMGTTRPGKRSYAHHPSGNEMKYIIKTLRFRAPKSRLAGDVRPFSAVVALKGEANAGIGG